MIIKIWLPKFIWSSITKYGGNKEHPNMIEVILRAYFLHNIKELVNDLRNGNDRCLKNYYKTVIYGRYCFISGSLAIEIYEALEKEKLFLEISEIEYFLSYCLLKVLIKKLDMFFGNSHLDAGNAM